MSTIATFNRISNINVYIRTSSKLSMKWYYTCDLTIRHLFMEAAPYIYIYINAGKHQLIREKFAPNMFTKSIFGVPTNARTFTIGRIRFFQIEIYHFANDKRLYFNKDAYYKSIRWKIFEGNERDKTKRKAYPLRDWSWRTYYNNIYICLAFVK